VVVDFLKAMNQIADLVSSSRSTGSGTEMSAAAEGAAVIDLAFA
jgi:hypothetical protein